MISAPTSSNRARCVPRYQDNGLPHQCAHWFAMTRERYTGSGIPHSSFLIPHSYLLIPKKISPEIRGDFFLVSAVYRLPLSYGMPSAFGALERLEVKASTIREVMYGSILYTPDGMFRFARNGKPE